jgi:hypothetical protein
MFSYWMFIFIWKKIRNGEHSNFYFSPSIINMVKHKFRMKWAGHELALLREMRSACKVLEFEKLKGIVHLVGVGLDGDTTGCTQSSFTNLSACDITSVPCHHHHHQLHLRV